MRMRARALGLWGALGVVFLLTALMTLAACGSPSAPAPSGGTYTSDEFHFSVSYPDGWQANVAPDASDTIPLTVIITRTSSTQVASQVASFTVSVTSLKALAEIEKKPEDQVVNLAGDKTLTKTEIGGKTAYAAAPIKQQIPGSDASMTHTDYYLISGDYEYQISTQSIDGDGSDAALQTMLQSLTFTS